MHPCLLRPAVKDYLWGGRRLIDEYGVKTTAERVAEAWMLSCHPDGFSIIDSGFFAQKALADVLFLETRNKHEKNMLIDAQFPVIVKLIDAQEDLSIQVHPNDAYARRYEADAGKRECWYVLDAAPEAVIYAGFQHAVTKDDVKKHVRNKSIPSLLNKILVKPGDTFWIEPETVHAIGAGVLIVEISQNSNCTYRVYDYDRTDSDGHKRELHLDRALDVMTLAASDMKRPSRTWKNKNGMLAAMIADCACFRVDIGQIATKGYYSRNKACHTALLFLAGRAKLTFSDGPPMMADKGTCAFFPAADGSISVEGKCCFLVISCPKT